MAALKLPPAILEIVNNYAKEQEKTFDGALSKLVRTGYARHLAVRKALSKNRKKRAEDAKKKALEAKKRRAARRAAPTQAASASASASASESESETKAA